MKISRLTLILSLSLFGNFSHAAELPNADEKVLIHEANVALAQKDYATAYAKFAALAEQGKPGAQFNLGVFYLNGQGVQKDDKLAYEWFEKSAAQGHARSQQLIEKAAAQGNVYAANELKKLQEQIAAKAQADAQAQAQTQAQAQAQADKPQTPPQEDASPAEDPSLFKDPTFASRGKKSYGVSADIFSNRISESLQYSVAGNAYSKKDTGDFTQSGISAWAGKDDISVTGSFRRGSGNINTATPNAGSINKSFQTKDIEIDGRWIVRKLSSDRLLPYLVAGYAQKSKNGVADAVQYQDIYTQTDRVLLAGAGAIFLLNQEAGVRVEARAGADSQKRSGNNLAGAYSTSNTATYSGLSATLFYDLIFGLNAQFGANYEKYSGGAASTNTSFFAKLGYSYK